ncbi:MAG: LamG-like jellyroll fold domain-containing protein, partial [Terriglobia bacterium]
KHVVAVREKGRLKLYINGELKATSAVFDNEDYDISSRAPLLMGFGAQNYLSGSLDDVRVYGGALTAGQVSDLYRRAAG